MRFLKRWSIVILAIFFVYVLALCIAHVEHAMAPHEIPDREYIAQVDHGVIDVTKPPSPSTFVPRKVGAVAGLADAFVNKALATGYSIDVTGIGAVGDGTTDDAAAFQAAATALSNTGGVIWVPPNKVYAIGSTITIQSYYPISILSDMGSPDILDVGTGTFTHAKGYIKPIATLTGGIFKWIRPAGSTQFEEGGSWARGLVFMDSTSGGRNYTIGDNTSGGCINFTDNSLGGVSECYFFQIKGRCIYTNNAQVHMDEIHARYCGDSSKPVIHLDTADSFVWLDRAQIENTYSAPSIQADTGSGLNLRHSSFEADVNIVAQKQKYVAGGGGMAIRGCHFGRNDGQYVELTADNDEITDCVFDAGFNTDLTEPFLTFSGDDGRLSGLVFRNAPSQVAYALTVSGVHNKISDIRAFGCGNINITNLRNVLSDIQVRNSVTTQNYQILLGQLCQLDNAYVFQGGTNGIYVAQDAICSGSRVEISTANKNGIVAAAATSQLVGNWVAGASGTGKNFVYFGGCVAEGNFGYPTSNSTTTDSITLDAESGILTTKSLTTAENAGYQITLSNAHITTGSRVTWSVDRGSATAGYATPAQLIVANGTAIFTWFNSPSGGGAYNGTYRVHFNVTN